MSKVTTAPWADTVRGFAMVLIILGHTIGYCDSLRPLSIYLSSFYVPLFFVVSGYLFAPDQRESIPSFMKRKALHILVPYYIFALISLIPFTIFSVDVQEILQSDRVIDNPLLHSLFHIIYASGHSGGLAQNSPLWFLPCYFTVIVLAKAVSQKVHLSRKYASALLALAFLTIGYIVYRYCNYAFPYCLETALIMLFFFFMGRQVRISHLTLVRRPWVPALLLTLGFVAHLFNGKISCMNNNYDEHFIPFVIAATCTSLGILSLFSHFKPQKFLAYLGVHTIPFLVMHKMPIVLFQTKVPYISQALRAGTWPVQLAASIFVVAATIGLCLLVYKITVKKLPWIYGESS